MCIMDSKKFRKIQSALGLTQKQMSELLYCSVSAVAAYRASSGIRKRNIPPLVEKVLMDKYLKAGGDLKDLNQYEDKGYM